MPFSLSPEHVLALAPDELSKKNGRGLARLDKWYALQCNDRAAWGECQGSGKNRYQTQVEFNQLKSNCSCPSRKVPCKHALGLLLLMASQPQSFAPAAPPPWVEEWLTHQRDRPAGKPTGQVVDPEAQAKRAQARQEKVNAGVAELELWLRDLLRQGFATAPVKSYRFWDEMGARLVDAQAPGLARAVREMAGVPHTGALWVESLLEQVGKLWLLLEGYKRLDERPPGMQADLRSLVGWTQNQEELLQQSGVRDRWLVAGQRQEEDTQAQYKVQRTWLVGDRTGASALLLDFAYGNNPLDASWILGSWVEAELVFYPSAHPWRSLAKGGRGTPEMGGTLSGDRAIPNALKAYTQALANHPWIDPFPLSLTGVMPIQQGDTWAIADRDGHLLPLSPAFAKPWHLLALCGAADATVFGEWNGKRFLPLSAFQAGNCVKF